jgi:hypothetical protein
VLGVSRGMILAYVERKTIDDILKKITKKTDDGEE